MERNVQVLGSYGARERLVIRSSNPFMQPLSAHKKAASILSPSTPSVPSTPTVEPSQRKSAERRLTFEEEQTVIAARNEREQKQRIIIQHHKLALKANNMGVFHERIGRLDKALQCYHVSLKAVSETKCFKTPNNLGFSSCRSTVVPQNPKTPIVVNVKDGSVLLHERTLITTITMCNLGSMYRRSGNLGRAMEFYNLAYKTVASGDSEFEDEESEKLQARLLEYIESNVMLVSEEEKESGYCEESEDDDFSDDEIEMNL